MSIYSKTALKVLYNDLTTGQFKDAQVIPISRLRQFVEDVIDSSIFPEDEASTTGPWKQIRVDLKTIAALPAFTAGTGPDGEVALLADANGALTVDGVTPGSDNRNIIVSEDGIYNGVYYLAVQGSASNPWILSRRRDSRTSDSVFMSIYYVKSGGVNIDKYFQQTSADVDTAVFEEFTFGASDGFVILTGTISSADILTGNSVPFEMWPSPGATSGIVIDYIQFKRADGTPYAGEADVPFEIFVGSTSILGPIPGILSSGGASITRLNVPSQSPELDGALTFQVLASDPTDGDFNLVYEIKYKIVTI